MKYLNSLVFLGLMVMVAGCQKKDSVQPKKAALQPVAKVAKGKKGPKKLEAKDASKGCGYNSKAKKASNVKVQNYNYYSGYYDGGGE